MAKGGEAYRVDRNRVAGVVFDVFRRDLLLVRRRFR